MRQFFHGDDAAYAELERRATGRCVVFYEQELPPGCAPRAARIGFEVDAAGTGRAILYVQKGIAYDGPDAGVRTWLQAGQRVFPTFAALRCWILRELAALYPPPICAAPDCRAANAVHARFCGRCGQDLESV